MNLVDSFSIFQTLTAAVLLLGSIALAFKVRRDIPASLRGDIRKTITLLFFIFTGYIFFVFIFLGNIRYPMHPVTTSMLLGTACFVYFDIMLMNSFTKRINEKDKEINSYAEKLTERTESLEREMKERGQAEKDLRLLEKAIDETMTGITVRDLDGKIIYTNKAEASMHGYTREELMGREIGVFSVQELTKHMTVEELKEAKTWVRESINIKKDGAEFPVRLVSDVVKDDTGEPLGIVTTCEDITDQKQAEQKLIEYQGHLEKEVAERTNKLMETVNKLENEVLVRKRTEEQIAYLAYYDSLTNLPNRVLFLDRLSQALEHARRHHRLVAVLFLDLDHFKRINDTMGHATGDSLLKGVAERLSHCLRKSDSFVYWSEEPSGCVSRLGGDEFVVFLNEIAHVQDTVVVAERLLQSIAQPYSINGQEVYITSSIGITLYPQHGEDAACLLKNSDIAMYQAKDQGRNNYQFFNSAMTEAVVEKLALENSLRAALGRDELLVYYQPQIDMRTKKVVCMEALCRWRHRERGMISPAEFIPIAEENGLIVPIGEWVLKNACMHNRSWQESGGNGVGVAVNLSSYQFRQQRLVETVDSAIKEHRLDPRLIELELTESIIMRDAEETILTLKKLKDMGIRISIDDFGTGYSSLSYLKRFPIDALKIDASFVRDIATSADDAAITRTIISMAHNLNLKVVAEGVETEEQRDFLMENGCDVMQGYLFCPPVPAEQAVELVAKETWL